MGVKATPACRENAGASHGYTVGLLRSLIHRREAIRLAAAAAAPLLLSPSSAFAQPGPLQGRLPSAPGTLMPIDFTGLSYEAAQLYNPEFFSPRNTALVEAFRNLTPNGVLRLGGHLSNITPWEGAGQNDPKQQAGVRHGIDDYWEWPLVDPSIQKNKHGMITRRALTNLAIFLRAVNWRLLYTLNFASGSPARAADEAAAVQQSMGDRLLAFLIGNEVDGYAEDRFFRPPSYSFDQYLAEFKQWVAAIRARVPHAAFAGPETDGHVADWVIPFAQRTRGQVVLLTSHFYGMGPASDPAMTAQRLLQPRNGRLEDEIAAVGRAVAASGTPYRMDEGNSCFGGGRPGVSDAYASALWVADYMLHVACAGFTGVNLHGGGTGFYTPVETSEAFPVKPRPLYFGMQFAQQFAGFTVAPCPLQTTHNATAYFGRQGRTSLLAIINKDPRSIDVRLPSGPHWQPTCRTLRGPSLDAKDGVHLAESALEPHSGTVALPPYSALLLHATS
jgi:hypothetical protein